MPNLGLIIIKIIIWNHIQIITSSVSFSNEWNDWIIIPARSETIFGGSDSSKNFSVFDVNSSKSVNDLVNSKEMESFIMRTVKINEPWKQDSIKLKSEINHFEEKSDVAIPLGGAIEKVKAFCSTVMEFVEENLSNIEDNKEQLAGSSSRKLKKLKKKYKKFLFPLLIAYKLKFLALIPLLMGGLVLLVGTTGMAGFFFALFTAVMSLKSESKVEVKKW